MLATRSRLVIVARCLVGIALALPLIGLAAAFLRPWPYPNGLVLAPILFAILGLPFLAVAWVLLAMARRRRPGG